MKSTFFQVLLVCLSCTCFCQSTEQLLKSGMKKMKEKDIAGAIKDFTSAIKLDSNSELGYTYRATCYMAQGKWESAIPDCTNAIKINPNQAVAYFIRGCAKGNLKKDGCTDLEKSLSLGYNQAQLALDKYCK